MFNFTNVFDICVVFKVSQVCNDAVSDVLSISAKLLFLFHSCSPEADVRDSIQVEHVTSV